MRKLISTLFLLTTVLSTANADIIGVTVDGIGSSNTVGNTVVRAALGATPAVEYFIPLGAASGVYGVGNFGMVPDSGVGGGVLTMYMMFAPVSIIGPSRLDIIFEDLDLIGANDPMNFLEQVSVFDQSGNLIVFLDDIANAAVSGNEVTQQAVALDLGTIGSSPLWISMEFTASFPTPAGNSAEYLIADVSAGTVSVPEPGTLALLGIGLFGMGLSRRKKV